MKKKLNLVLLIDDDYPTNCFNEMMIEDEGVAEKIITIQSAAEALDFLAGKGIHEGRPDNMVPDLIFLDINMPAMNGWEFLEAYKLLPFHLQGSIVVVMLTASPSPDDESKAQSMTGVTGFLNKPLTPPMLHQVLREHFLEYC